MSLTAAGRQIAQQRELFLSGSVPQSVREEVVKSWQRCSTWLSPDRIGPQYQPDVDRDSPLLRAATPVLDRMSERLGRLGVSFVLTDEEARILDRRVSDKTLLDALDSVEAAPGFVYGEDAVGNNGLGTTIELGRVARVDGHEHYAQQLVHFTCVGVPITDPLSRRRLGVIDVTCAADPDNTAVEELARRTAQFIEQRLFDQQSEQERALLREFMAACRHQHGGIVVINDRLMMTNPQAARLLQGTEQPVVWEHLGSIIQHGGHRHGEFTLPDGRTARTRATPLRHGQVVVGALMEIQPTAPAARETSPPRGLPSGPLPGLAGTSPSFRTCCREAADAPDSRILVLRGEPGVGKTAIAETVHRRATGGTGAEPVVDDAADVERLGVTAWLDRLRERLAAPAAAVIVQHLEFLTEPVLRTVAAVLTAAMERGWRCSATHTGAASVHDVLPGVATQVWVPPLRSRLEDVPALATAFGGSRPVTPEAAQLLMRLVWPGNVRELRAVVDQMSEAAPPGMRPGLAEVPLQIRKAAPRRSLSRFERAEVHAILEALAETRGNKKDAAALLGISRSTLYRKMQAAGVDLDNTVF